MKNILVIVFCLLFVSANNAQTSFETDTFKTSAGILKITFIGHGTLMFEYNNLVIHIDPVERYADYSKLPKADLILITHQHGDHLDANAVKLIKKDGMKIFCNKASLQKASDATVMKNGKTAEYKGIKIKSVPAYNLINRGENGEPFHPKGIGNGYALTFADTKVYVAGDTENVPEMKNLYGIDIAFLPMNLPYTMTPQMVVDAVNMFNPKILYPYHFGNSNVNDLLELLKDKKDCEVRIRKMN